MQLGLTANGTEARRVGPPPRAALLSVALVSGTGVAFLATTEPAGLAAGLIGTIARAGFWGLILVAAARIGAWIVGSREVGIGHLAWDGAVGLAVLISIVLAIGMLPGAFRPVVIVTLLAGFAAAGLARARRDPLSRFSNLLNRSSGSTWAAAAVGAVAVAGMSWNRVPVLFFDTLAYHYAQPELWLLNGRIAAESWSLHSWFPPGMSVLYGLGLAVGDETWANDANLLLGIALALTAFDFARRLWGPAAGLIAVGLLMALPQIPFALAIPAADLGHGLFVAGALCALYLARGDADSRWAIRAAYLAGGAVSTKYLGFLVPLALGAVWILVAGLRRDDRSLTNAVGRSLRWMLPALLLVSPWLVANAFTVGNPIAPMFDRALPPHGLAEGGAERFRQDARGGLPGMEDVRELGGGLITGSSASGELYPGPAWGWTVVALLPVFLIGLIRDREVRLLLSLAATVFLIWFVTYRWERFLVATTLLLAVTAAGATVAVWKRGRAARGLPVAVAIVALLSVVHAVQEIAMFTGGVRVALGLESPRSFVQFSFPTTRFYRESAELLDRGSAHVLLFGEMRHYRLPVRRTAPTAFNTHPLVESLARTHDATASNRELREQGYTHLLVDLGWVARSAEGYPSLALFRQQPELLDVYLTSLGPPLHLRGRLGLFEIPE